MFAAIAHTLGGNVDIVATVAALGMLLGGWAPSLRTRGAPRSERFREVAWVPLVLFCAVAVAAPLIFFVSYSVAALIEIVT